MAPFRKKHEALNRMRALHSARSEPIAVLDIGDNKIACLIVRPDGVRMDDQVLRISGVGHQLSRGIKSGVVVDMDAAEGAIRAAVDKAERMSGQTLSSIRLAVSAGKLQSHRISVDVDIGGYEITDKDMARAYRTAMSEFPLDGITLLHALPLNYAVDGRDGVCDPRGLFAERLTIDLHLVTTPAVPLRNLVHVVERCHLDVSAITAAPYAAGLSALTHDEREQGCVCIDLGGGSTGISVFTGNTMQFLDIIPVGSGHITSDIAHGLSTPRSVAERLKTMKGAAVIGPRDDYEQIEFPQVGDVKGGDHNVVQSPKVYLNRIIGPRIEETLELVQKRLVAAGFSAANCPHVVLVGGGSQLTGVKELAGRILSRQVRLGRPMRLTGLVDEALGPGFAAVAGGLAHGCFGPMDAVSQGQGGREASLRPSMDVSHLPLMQRAMYWVKENF